MVCFRVKSEKKGVNFCFVCPCYEPQFFYVIGGRRMELRERKKENEKKKEKEREKLFASLVFLVES